MDGTCMGGLPESFRDAAMRRRDRLYTQYSSCLELKAMVVYFSNE